MIFQKIIYRLFYKFSITIFMNTNSKITGYIYAVSCLQLELLLATNVLACEKTDFKILTKPGEYPVTVSGADFFQGEVRRNNDVLLSKGSLAQNGKELGAGKCIGHLRAKIINYQQITIIYGII